MNNELLQFLSVCRDRFAYYESLEKTYGYTKQSIFAWLIFTAMKIVFIVPVVASFTLWCLEFIYIGDYVQDLFGRRACIEFLLVVFAVLIFYLSVKKRRDGKRTMKDIKKIFSSPEYLSFYQQAPSVLGDKYCTEHACSRFYEYLSCGRCADLMMAKNLYEQELAQERLEQAVRDRISADLATEQREKREKEAKNAEEERIRQDIYRRSQGN